MVALTLGLLDSVEVPKAKAERGGCSGGETFFCKYMVPGRRQGRRCRREMFRPEKKAMRLRQGAGATLLGGVEREEEGAPLKGVPQHLQPRRGW